MTREADEFDENASTQGEIAGLSDHSFSIMVAPAG